MSKLPPNVTIGPAPARLELGEDGDDGHHDYDWSGHSERRSALSSVQAAEAFPESAVVDAPESLRGEKLFPCSGSPDSTQYREASKFRAMKDMTWDEARVALKRLLELLDRYRAKTNQYVAIAEFALTAINFLRESKAGFVGRRGEHAVKLRDELDVARRILRKHLRDQLQKAENNTAQLSRPLTERIDIHDSYDFADRMVRAFWTVVPTATKEWVPVVKATPEQTISALDYLRATLATWAPRRPVAVGILDRLLPSDETLPTAAEYAEAIHIADMLAFTTEKLATLYAGIIHSMPIYQLYPTVSESEAITLWWPWGRPAPLVDSAPPRPPKPRRQQLDPSIITASRPQDVVREVMEKTGMNRTTAQSLTASLRAKMRSDREWRAKKLLLEGLTKAEVAKRVGLSPSRISALFKGDESIAEEREYRRARDAQRVLDKATNAVLARHRSTLARR